MTAGPPRRYIADREDIAGLVTAFYRWAFVDDILGPIFVDVAQMDLPAHLPVMCDTSSWPNTRRCSGPLHDAGLEQLLSHDSMADAVIATLPRPGHLPRRLSPHRESYSKVGLNE